MKFLTAKNHKLLDYATVAIFLLAPTILGLTGLAAVIAYVLAGVHLAMSLTTVSVGVRKLIPFQIHGYIEYAVGPVLIALPFVLGFTEAALTFYVTIGLVILVVGLITDYVPKHHMIGSTGAGRPKHAA